MARTCRLEREPPPRLHSGDRIEEAGGSMVALPADEGDSPSLDAGEERTGARRSHLRASRTMGTAPPTAAGHAANSSTTPAGTFVPKKRSRHDVDADHDGGSGAAGRSKTGLCATASQILPSFFATPPTCLKAAGDATMRQLPADRACCPHRLAGWRAEWAGPTGAGRLQQ